MKDAFDDLSKALASGMSRRDALRKFGIAVAGSLFFLRPGFAGAKTPKEGPTTQQQCDQFCLWLYGPKTSAYKTCKSQANAGYGACYDFGPASPNCNGVNCPNHSFCVSNSMNMNFNSTMPEEHHCVPYPHF
jgi:hypothetical protein